MVRSLGPRESGSASLDDAARYYHSRDSSRNSVQIWEQTSAGSELISFGNSKGLELIPGERVEAILNVPPYLEHNRAGLHDGFGDVSFLGKYRGFPALRVAGITL
jgi:hypothetical protein